MSTKEKNSVVSAKGLLGSLTAGKKSQEDGVKVEAEQEAQTTHQAESQEQPLSPEQAPEHNGKAPLPPDEPEEVPDDEDDVDQDFEEDAEDREEEPVFTDQDKADLPVQEGKFKHHGVEQARAIIEIRQRKLWMLHRSDDGSRKYKTFDLYMDVHWGYTRQWVSQLTKWLKVMDLLGKLGLSVRLSANAANGLWQLDAAGGYQGSTEEEQEENGLVAVIQEAQEDGITFSRDNLRAICERRSSYFREKKGSHPPAAATYAAYKQDCTLAMQLAKGGSFGVVKEAKELPGDFADNLLKLCSDQRKLPRADDLLEAVTGHDLEIIIPRLNTLAQDVAATETKKNLLKTRKAEIRAMLQEGGLAKLREEAKALQTELEQKGVIKKRGGKKDDAGDGSQVQQGEEAAKESAGDEAGEDEPNGVKEELDTAFTYIEAALDADWPTAENGKLIQAILDAALDCEEKLTEIINRAKELLADVEKPQKQPEQVQRAAKPLERTVKPLDPSDPDSF